MVVLNLGVLVVALAVQSPGLKVGQKYDCHVLKAASATEFWANVDGAEHNPVHVLLPKVESAPKSSWAFEAGQRFLMQSFGPERNRNYPSHTKLQIESIGKSNTVTAEFYYVAHHDDGNTYDPNESDFPVSDDLVRLGFARLKKADDPRMPTQEKARRETLGMWTAHLPVPTVGQSFDAARIQAYSPTTFSVVRMTFDGYNTKPALKVREANVVEPPRGSQAYRSAMTFAKGLGGTLVFDRNWGRLDATSRVCHYDVVGKDRDGTLVCRVTYTVFSPDTPNGMFAASDCDFGEDLLEKGYVRIDPKAQDVSANWRAAQDEAKKKRLGIWANP